MRLTTLLLSLCLAPTLAANTLPLADRVLVDKSDRRLYLLQGEQVLASFPVSLGQEPSGHKTEEGDSRTPEGEYRLGVRNPDSDFFLSIHISYPNAADRAQARARGLSPGGLIMIHGRPNEPKYSTEFYRTADWTDGCIAVSNSAMIDIWLMTNNGTPIEIRP
ncbi:MAG: L,D-transpeptidase family protein [Pseudomonadota bacterium]